MLDELLDRFHRKDRSALARLLSLLAHGSDVDALLAGLGQPARRAQIVAITGGGGVGKSTLVGKLIEVIRRHGQTVAVLACDPQSTLSGGALLGDRVRMPSRPDDYGVFIRSLAAPSGHGAVAQHLGAMVRLLEAFGFDVVLIETVGAGQGDVAVRGLADVVVLLLQPETGDDLQWEKAGLLEVADLVVIHKADLPGAERVEAQVRAELALSSAPAAPVLRVSAKASEGVEQLWSAIAACPRRQADGTGKDSGLLSAAQETLARWFAAVESRPPVQELIGQWRQGRLTNAQATAQLLHHFEQDCLTRSRPSAAPG
jgi:LAO/AO transport system ATPase